MSTASTSILGVNVSHLTYQKTLQAIEKVINEWGKNGKHKGAHYICVAAVHLIMECQRDEQLKAGVNKALLVTPDGMPLVWLLKADGAKQVERVYGPDLMLKVCQLAEQKKWTIFLLGGAKGQSAQVKKQLLQKYPQLKIIGALDTPHRLSTQTKQGKKEHATALQLIKQTQPDIVFIGTGCPHQEHWMIEHHQRVKAKLLLGVGAAFDFISGKVKQAPKWMQRAGLEWLFRLIQEPKRLFKRYVHHNTHFVLKIIASSMIGFTKKRKTHS